MGLFSWLFGSKQPPTLQDRLQSPVSAIRREAAEELGKTLRIDAIAPLVAAAQDQEPEVQTAARNSLISIAVATLKNDFISARSKILAIEVLDKVGLMQYLCQPQNSDTQQRIGRALKEARRSAEFELDQARMGNLSAEIDPSSNNAQLFQAADRVLKAFEMVTAAPRAESPGCAKCGGTFLWPDSFKHGPMPIPPEVIDKAIYCTDCKQQFCIQCVRGTCPVCGGDNYTYVTPSA